MLQEPAVRSARSFAGRVRVASHWLAGVLAPFIVLLSSAGYSGCAAVDSAESRTPAAKTKIAFVSDRDGNCEIYVMNPDGSQLRNLTNNEASDSYPSWSPDGKSIVFVSDRNGNTDIYRMDADGAGVEQLTFTPSEESSPVFSPDGERIAFAGRFESIYVMDSDAGIPSRLAEGWSPSWSPEGRWLLYTLGQIPSMMIMEVEDGTSRPLGVEDFDALSKDERFELWFSMHPIMSPNGTTVLFTKVMLDTEDDDPGMNYEVFSMGVDGQDRQRLTTELGLDSGYGWSPEGAKIVFTSERDGSHDIYVMNADGSEQVSLTKHGGTDSRPSWSPVLAGE